MDVREGERPQRARDGRIVEQRVGDGHEAEGSTGATRWAPPCHARGRDLAQPRSRRSTSACSTRSRDEPGGARAPLPRRHRRRRRLGPPRARPLRASCGRRARRRPGSSPRSSRRARWCRSLKPLVGRVRPCDALGVVRAHRGALAGRRTRSPAGTPRGRSRSRRSSRCGRRAGPRRRSPGRRWWRGRAACSASTTRATCSRARCSAARWGLFFAWASLRRPAVATSATAR